MQNWNKRKSREHEGENLTTTKKNKAHDGNRNSRNSRMVRKSRLNREILDELESGEKNDSEKSNNEFPILFEKKCKCKKIVEIISSESTVSPSSSTDANDNVEDAISYTIKQEASEDVFKPPISEQKEAVKSVKSIPNKKKESIHQKADYLPIEADDIGRCFARGFRPDNMLLSGDACFKLNKQDKQEMSPHMLKNTESIISFSERESPLDFLLALGFMVDEASNALKDEDIRSRLLAAITEARVWINKITTTQGTLLYLVAYKSRPETMRYFLQLVEAIINKRINNAIKLDGYLRVLEQVEDGRLQLINILGENRFDDDENEEVVIKKQLRHLFITIYKVAEKEAFELNKYLENDQVDLLRILVGKYRAGLHPHLELIARYVGQGLLITESQLEAAMIFLSRLDTADVKLREFENYCGITCADEDNPTQ